MNQDRDHLGGDRPSPDLFDDDVLLVELGFALDAADRIPPHLSQYASELFALGGLDAELAQLTYDSLLAVGTATRHGDGPRVLVFTGSTWSVEIEVDGERMLGQLVPPGSAEVSVQLPGESIPTTVSASGTFAFPRPIGRFRLLVTQASDRLVTPWIDFAGDGDTDAQPAP